MYSDCLKERTPGEPERFSMKPAHITALKAKKKHPPLQEGQDPLDHTPVLRLVGVPLWTSLQTWPDKSWAIARITRMAAADQTQATICIRHVAQYLRWTLLLPLFDEPARKASWDCYTDARWSPEGD